MIGDHLELDLGYDTPCWLWQRAILQNGYGSVRIEGKTLLAHRVYYELTKGPISKDKELDHLCRNRSCVNPEHLEAVTRRENARRGTRTRLTKHQVIDIKCRLAEKSPQWLLAFEFDVSPGAIADISAGRTWKDVSP